MHSRLDEKNNRSHTSENGPKKEFFVDDKCVLPIHTCFQPEI